MRAEIDPEFVKSKGKKEKGKGGKEKGEGGKEKGKGEEKGRGNHFGVSCQSPRL